MEKILFLDDSQERYDKFFDNHKDDLVIISTTATDAIEELKNMSYFDIVSLDHDLEGTFQDSNDANCGMEVVRWIEENKPIIKLIIVHSWNIDAAIEMDERLRRAGYFVERKMFGFN